MIHKELSHFFDGAFTDKRIDKRANKLIRCIIDKGSVVVYKCCATITEKIGAYRMLNNAKVTEKSLKESLYQNCLKHVKGSHVLCIQDTSEINFTTKTGRIREEDPDIGPVTKNSNSGFYLHPMLTVDADTYIPLGFSAVKMWNRSRDKKSKSERKYKYEAIEQKESYRWIETALESLQTLPATVRQTVIGDRESDIYEAFHLLPGERCDLLVRSSSNRTLVGEDCLLLEKMQSQPVVASYDLWVKGNHSRKNRTAHMDLRYGQVEIKKPENVKGDYPGSIILRCIYVVEQSGTVPKGESKIEWRLLTTHQLESVEDAMRCIEWYKLRWYIEEIFRLIKSEGMDIEQAQLESGAALKKLTLLALIAAWHIMTLKLSLDRKEEDVSCTILFTNMQIELLQILQTQVEGNTQKQKNPFKRVSLPWAAWTIARLAGWSGYKSHGKAGYITFKSGYQDFMSKFQAFELIKDVYKE